MANIKSRPSLYRSLVIAITLVLGAFSTPSVAIASGTTTLSLNGVSLTTGLLASAPVLVPVPSDNVVDAADAVKVSISGLTSNTSVSITTNNSSVVPALSSSISTVKSNDGVTSSSTNIGTGTSLEFYVFTKTSALSSFTVSILGNTTTYYLKGISGPAYDLVATIPSTGYIASFRKVSMKVTDVFGNAVSNITPAISVVNLSASSPIVTNSEGLTETTLTYPSVIGQSAIGISITATDVVGLPVAKKSITTFIDVKDPVSELTAEKSARAQEKIDSEKKLSEVQNALNTSLGLKTTSENALSALQSTFNQYKSDSERKLVIVQSQLSKLNKTLNTTIAKYNTLAKKYKQPIIKR